MKTLLVIAFALLFAVTPGFSEPSQKEIIALMNRVEARVAGGDASALNDLMTLPEKWAVPAFLTIFKENYNIYGATAENRAIGIKCAQLATSVPGGEKYFASLMKKQPDGSPNWLYIQQETAMKCLQSIHNKMAVRLFCRALDEPEFGGRAANQLAMMRLPDAPYVAKRTGVDDESTPAGIAQWKEWWKSHESDYTDNSAPETAASPSPAPAP